MYCLSLQVLSNWGKLSIYVVIDTVELESLSPFLLLWVGCLSYISMRNDNDHLVHNCVAVGEVEDCSSTLVAISSPVVFVQMMYYIIINSDSSLQPLCIT